jgi:membrane protein DedA with SNARE-associated domain
VGFINQILFQLSAWIEHVIQASGYAGIVFLMALESCNVPIPSEAILTFAGLLVHKGVFNFHLAALAGAVGCVVGSVPSYMLGAWGGRSFLEKHGKWLLLSTKDLDDAEVWVAKYGDLAFFLCRMLPVVRTFISLPAGILKARIWPFVIYTFIGSWIWSYFLVWVGVKFGENMEAFKHVWHQFDALIVGVCLVAGVWYIYHHIKRFKEAN